MHFAKKFKWARKKARLTQGQAAKKLGVSLRSIQGWEAGESIPPASALTQESALAALGGGK